MVGSTAGTSRATPLARGGLADPVAEGIHQDTDGPDKASDSGQDFAHLSDCYLALADFDMSTFRLGHGPHLLPSSSPARTLRVFRGKVPTGGRPNHASSH